MAGVEDGEELSEEEEEDWSAPLDQPGAAVGEGQDQNWNAPSTASCIDSTGSLSSLSKESSAKSESSEKGGLMSRMQLNDHKAGMKGLDRERINKIIYEASKGSRFYENEMKKEEQVNARIEEYQKRLAQLTPEDIRTGEKESDVILRSLESSRKLSRCIVHVDMDAFYAAVEMRDNPALLHVPMAVGSNSMLSTSNYLARRFGVRAAMPGFIGRKLCPDLVIVETHFDKYTAVSKQVRAIMADYDPNFCPMSLDEAYLDLTDHLEKRASLPDGDRTFLTMLSQDEICNCDKKKNNAKAPGGACGADNGSFGATEGISGGEAEEIGSSDCCSKCGRPRDTSRGKLQVFGVSAEEAVREMRARVHWETKLTASAGIAPNTMLAKVCSDKNKPNGQYYMNPDLGTVLDFIKTLDVRKVSGIGKVAARVLNSLGVATCTDLHTMRGALYHLYSETSLHYFLRISLGIGSTTVERDGERKSMSTERTFNELREPKDLYKKCHELSISLAEDMNEEQLVGKTVGIKLKTVNFKLMTRAHTLLNHTSDAEQIYTAARELLRAEILLCQPEPLRLRLMGVRMSNLMPKNAAGDQKQCTITSLISKMKAKPPRPDPSQVDQNQTLPSATCISDKPNLVSQDLTQSRDDPTEESSQAAAKPSGSCNTLWLRSGRVARKTKTYSCPICSEEIPASSLEVFNCHIDECIAGVSGSKVEEPDVPDNSGVTEGNAGETLSRLDEIERNRKDNMENQKDSETPRAPESENCSITDLHAEFSIGSPKCTSENPAPFDDQTGTVNNTTNVPCEISEEGVNVPQTLNSDTGEDHYVVTENQREISASSKRTIAHEKVDDVTQLKGDQCGTSIHSTAVAESDSISMETESNHSEKSNKLVCPVCNETQSSADLGKFNNHVDVCLSRGVLNDDAQLPRRSNNESSVEDRTDTGRNKKTKTPSRKKSSNQKKRDVMKSVNTNSIFSSQTALQGLHGAARCAPGENAEKEADTCMTCPVCELSQEWTSPDAFSRHVDACLNRTAIKEMLQSDPSPHSKRHSTSPPEEPVSKRKKANSRGMQRIDAFFKH